MGTATPAEQHFVERYFDSLDQVNGEEDPFAEMDPVKREQESSTRRMKIMSMLTSEEQSIVPAGKAVTLYGRKIRRMIAAAVLLLLIGTGLYLFLNRQPVSKDQIAKNTPGIIVPGHSGAVLTLADGTSVALDSADKRQIALPGGAQALNQNGQLQYLESGRRSIAITYNTLTTPKARQYSLVLPDGTKVWLNAGSSLRFPTAFTGSDRKVELKGEAYFEVVHNSKQPFKVLAAGQEIEDIGTSFNVSAYEDVPGAGLQATLVEGVIRVGGQQLRPGEAAVVTQNGRVRIEETNVEAAIAWKNGKFIFDREDIREVMRKLARWYDIDVVYQGNLPGNTFTGSVSRFDNIEKILDKITYTSGIHFQIKERRIIVNQ